MTGVLVRCDRCGATRDLEVRERQHPEHGVEAARRAGWTGPMTWENSHSASPLLDLCPSCSPTNSETALVELRRKTLDSQACAGPLCFVPLELYARADVEMYQRLRREGRFGAMWDRLGAAGIPNFLAFGMWIVPDMHREAALEAIR